MSGKRKNFKIILQIISSTLFVLLIFIYAYKNPYNFDINPPEVINLTGDSSVKILVVGDVMLDRNVRNIINKNGFDNFFNGVRPLIQDSDISIANLEGAFTPYQSITANLTNKDLQFTFDPALAPALSDLGFDVLGLANNHSFNFGQEGLSMTRRYIGQSGMTYYGDPFNKNEISTILTKNKVKIGIIGFHEFYYVNFDKIFNEIASLKSQVDFLIVTPHWGVEYDKSPTDKMRKWAHQFIDSGADVVIGAHPHIIGNIEEYKGKKIYYSLGNFVFDQYFSQDTMKGLAVLMDVNKNENSGKVNVSYQNILIKVDKNGVSTVDK